MDVKWQMPHGSRNICVHKTFAKLKQNEFAGKVIVRGKTKNQNEIESEYKFFFTGVANCVIRSESENEQKLKKKFFYIYDCVTLHYIKMPFICFRWMKSDFNYKLGIRSVKRTIATAVAIINIRWSFIGQGLSNQHKIFFTFQLVYYMTMAIKSMRRSIKNTESTEKKEKKIISKFFYSVLSFSVLYGCETILEHLIVLQSDEEALVCITLCRRSVLSRTERNYIVNNWMRMCNL